MHSRRPSVSTACEDQQSVCNATFTSEVVRDWTGSDEARTSMRSYTAIETLLAFCPPGPRARTAAAPRTMRRGAASIPPRRVSSVKRHTGRVCGRWHAGPTPFQAPTAEALMRSRYSAFMKQLGDYLQATWHASTRPAEETSEVEFVARSKLGGRAHRLHEASRSVREDGRWYYLDGDVLAGG